MELKVGMKVKKQEWSAEEYLTITAIGKYKFLALTDDGREMDVRLSDAVLWELYEPPKKTVKLAPALVSSPTRGTWSISTCLFASKEEVTEDYRSVETIWPAFPNKDGFYEVPE